MSAERKLLGNSIAREQFLLNEARIVARMRLEGMTEKEVYAKVKAENLFQYPTARTLQKISRACNKRIDALGSEVLVRAIAYGMPDAAAQANLYAMMRLYPLVRHFMVTEIAQKYATLDYAYSAMDMNAYFTRLASEYDNFATASAETVKKLKQVLRKSLASAGLLAGKHSDELVPIFLDPEVEEAIRELGDVEALRAFNCQEVF